MDEMVSTLTGTLQLGSDEEDELAAPRGATCSAASAASMRASGGAWVVGAPIGKGGRSKGAHLRVTLPAGSTQVLPWAATPAGAHWTDHVGQAAWKRNGRTAWT